jgi:menaquinone-specific isochorismate synthase
MTGIADKLAAAARDALKKATGHFARAEISVENISPLSWLAAQNHPFKGYWSARDGSLEVAGIGEADEIKSSEMTPSPRSDGERAGVRGRSEPEIPTTGNLFHQIFQRLENCDPEIRYFGGFRFGPWHPTDHAWRPFGAYRFLLPQIELVRRGDAVSLACNIPANNAGMAESTIAAIAGINMNVKPARGPLPPPLTRVDLPVRAQWDREIAAVQTAIADNKLRKLVLARRACFDFSQPLDAFELLMRLRESTADCYHFGGIHAGGRVAFMGASPERFFLRMDREILTEAVAGTRPRGTTPEEDFELAQDLMNSKKEREEHSIVVLGINEALAPLCVGLKHEPQPRIVKLARVQHLVTHFVGTLAPGIGSDQVFARLHPTPAVGGYPRDTAMEMLPQIEPFDRGWYCAPAGWISRDSSELAVAIRCGAVFGNRLCLYSGAGIVAGSDPESEWNEVEIKIGHFISALTHP